MTGTGTSAHIRSMSQSPAFRPFALKRPCGDCPFRSDKLPFLSRGRAQEIAESLHDDASFHCHQTLNYDNEEGSPEINDKSIHCAGALIIMEREGAANQMMRIGGRLGLYRPEDLDMDSPVYGSLDEWAEKHA